MSHHGSPAAASPPPPLSTSSSLLKPQLIIPVAAATLPVPTPWAPFSWSSFQEVRDTPAHNWLHLGKRMKLTALSVSNVPGMACGALLMSSFHTDLTIRKCLLLRVFKVLGLRLGNGKCRNQPYAPLSLTPTPYYVCKCSTSSLTSELCS